MSIAKKNNDTVLANHYWSVIKIIDLDNFKILEKIIIDIGFPNPKLLGAGTCYPFDVLYHWSKEYPQWFNSKENAKYFRKEIEVGNLPLSIIDMAHFLFVSFTIHDLSDFKLVNDARILYGLTPYTEDQYMKRSPIEPSTN